MHSRLAAYRGLLLSFCLWAQPGTVNAQQAQLPFTRTEDLIYGRKFGTALTLDVFEPASEKNGCALILVVSGGFFSSKEAINPGFCLPFLQLTSSRPSQTLHSSTRPRMC